MLVLALLLSAACTRAVTPTSTTTSATTTSMPATPTPTGPYGSLEFNVSSFNNDNFDLVKANRATILNMASPMFDYLIREYSTLTANKGVAEKWEMAPDGLSWTFNIRRGITFHDGSPLTAKDVKYSLDLYAGKDNFNAFIRNSQDRVDIVDDYTVRVFTKGVQPFYFRYVSSRPGNQGVVMPKDYIEKNGMAYFLSRPMGTGPFKFVRHVAADMVEYEALGQHYRQVPAFKKVTIVLVPELSTRLARLKTGEANAVEIGLDSVPAVEAAGLRTSSLAATTAQIFFFGAYDPRGAAMPLADVRVRTALSLAINRDEMNKSLFYGKLGPLMPAGLGEDQPEIDAAYWKAQSAQAYRYDPGQAATLLQQAGHASDITMKLWVYSAGGAEYLTRLAPVIQGYWSKIGVKTEVTPVDFTTFSAWGRSGPNGSPANELIGTAAIRTGGLVEIPAQRMQTYFTPNASYDLTSSKLGKNAELSKLITDGLTEPNAQKRLDMIAKAIQLAVDTRVAEPIGLVPAMVGLGPGLDIAYTSAYAYIPEGAEIARHRN